MALCLHLLPQMCSSLCSGAGFPWDTQTHSLLGRCWAGQVRGNISVIQLCLQRSWHCRGKGVTELPAWEGGFSKDFGHRVAECAVNLFAGNVCSGVFKGVSCVCCVWEAVLRAAGRFSCMAQWSLSWPSAQKCPLPCAGPACLQVISETPLHLGWDLLLAAQEYFCAG